MGRNPGASPVKSRGNLINKNGNDMSRRLMVLALALLLLIGGCARLPRTGLTTLKPVSLAELRGQMMRHPSALDEFRLRGPFGVITQKNHELRIAPDENIVTDLYLSAPAEKTSLVIFLHGLDNSKDDHAYQAWHVASWGMHSMVLQLPNQGPWDDNGRTLARIVEFVYRQPELIDRRIDVNRLILVGHSYGGAATAIALALGAPAAGGILLDPAGIGGFLPKFLGQVSKPVLVIGADERITHTRDRDYFYTYIRSAISEVSISGAAHADAQYPAEFPVSLFGGDSATNEENQITFVSAIAAGAFSFSATGRFDFAWASFGSAIKSGRIFNAKKK